MRYKISKIYRGKIFCLLTREQDGNTSYFQKVVSKQSKLHAKFSSFETARKTALCFDKYVKAHLWRSLEVSCRPSIVTSNTLIESLSDALQNIKNLPWENFLFTLNATKRKHILFSKSCFKTIKITCEFSSYETARNRLRLR